MNGLAAILNSHAQCRPQAKALTFLRSDGNIGAEWSYEQVYRRARAVGARLHTYAGARVLVPQGRLQTFVEGFLGCLFAGAIAVPVPLPRRDRTSGRIRQIIENCRPACVLISRDDRPPDSGVFDGLPCISSDAWEDASGETWIPREIESRSVALLQYTSGSTSDPKGVMVSYENLLANQQAIQHCFRTNEDSVVLSWLPLFHDMGLIGTLLQPLYAGAHGILMPPSSFSLRPLSWLSNISRFRATISGGPNSAYEICAARAAASETTEFDLTSWRVAFNGAEPVRTATMERFARTFARCGFDRRSFIPCYGLAEATLFVSGSRGVPDSEPHPSCGAIAPGHFVEIVDPNTGVALSDGNEGEIWVSGPSVALGIWASPAGTRESFEARLSGLDRSYLRTGDLGFTRNGEIYVTGRIKDLIIVGGRNYVPQDLEAALAASHPALRVEAIAAFSYQEEESEAVGVVAEIDESPDLDYEALVRAMRRSVLDEHELEISAVTLIRRGKLPRTTSGKIRRFACRDRFLSDSSGKLFEWRFSRATIARQIASLVASRLKGELPDDEPIVGSGIDSLGLLELSHQIEVRFGARISIADLLGGLTVNQVANQIRAAVPVESRSVPQLPRVQRFECTEGERALYLLDGLSHGSGAYHISRAARIREPFDTAKLRRCFERLCERHPALRSCFEQTDGRVWRHVPFIVPLNWRERDARQWDEARLDLEMKAEAAAPFDLNQPPLWRVCLYRTAASPIFQFTIHHLVADLWSLGLLLRDLDALYADPGSAGDAIDFGMASLAEEEQRYLAEEGQRLSAHWRSRFDTACQPLDLPADFPRQAVQTYRGAHFRTTLGLDQMRRIHELSRQQNTTVFTVLLTVFQIWLHRSTGQALIRVGTPLANRERMQDRGTVGYLVNPVALESRLEGDTTFAGLLACTNREIRSAMEHGRYPFPLLARDLQAAGDPSRNAVYQAAFVMHQPPPAAPPGFVPFAMNHTGAVLDLGGLRMETLGVESAAALFDITLTAGEFEGGLILELGYNSDLFEHTSAQAFLEQYCILLREACAGNADRRASEMNPLTTDEGSTLLCQRVSLAPGTRSIVELFEAQVESTPDRIAVQCGQTAVSYRTLNEQANRLAHYLRLQEVGPEKIVALRLERTPAMIAAILGVLKAGGAYLPVDPATPPQRTALMLRDARVSLLIAHDAAGPISSDGPWSIINLDSEAAAIARCPAQNPVPIASPDNLAYVIYTSGSTGRPKGVGVTHDCVVRLFESTRAWFAFDENDVWTLFHSFSFDFSVWEIWGPLLFGGRLLIVPYALSRSFTEFAAFLCREGVTILNQTPSAFRQLLAADRAGELARNSSLRKIIFGGEALNPAMLAPWFAHQSDRQTELVNMYGITETTVHVTYCPIPRQSTGRAASPIGEPIPDLKICLLDQNMLPVPFCVPGEIYVGGAGLARGYLHDAKLTAERFVPDQFASEPGARLYRSGDRARRLPNGELEYLGRCDSQVKVRGFRIEPAEVEATLRAYPGVREAIVDVRHGAAGGSSLVAWLWAESSTEPAADELRRFLEDRLPPYMVPAAFVRLEALPLTVNGKIDRKALPPPGRERPVLGEAYVPPGSQPEVALAKVWADVLQVDAPGIHDNFFALGGDSIRSLQILSRARDAGLDITVQQLFRNPTIAALAREAVAGGSFATRLEAFSLIGEDDRSRLPAEAVDAYPLTRVQAGLIFECDRSADYESYVTTLKVEAPFDEALMAKAVRTGIGRHPILRTSFDLIHFREPLQIVHREPVVDLKVEDWRAIAPPDAASRFSAWLLSERKQRPVWSQLPLVSFRLHRLTEAIFHLTLREPLLDGWSVGTLLSEVLSDYAELLAGKTSRRKPSANAAFADYVGLERQAIASAEHRAFWARELADSVPCLVGQSERRSDSDDAHVGRVEVAISGELSGRLQNIAAELGVPLKSVLLAAHLKAIGGLTGRQEIVTGLLQNGRPETAGGDEILGIFLNAVPLRAELAGATWAELIRAAYASEERSLPFRRFPLTDTLRLTGYAALFDSVFNFTHFHVYGKVQGIAGVSVCDAYASEQTYFDLTVQFNLDHSNGRLRLAIDYRKRAFPSQRAQRIGEFYARVLERLSDGPDQFHDCADLLADADRADLAAWNRTARLYPEGLCLHEWIERQVARSPNQAAVAFEGLTISYEELNARANRIAHYLLQRGVRAETAVAVLLERSADMLGALLGVMKSGAWYIPIDPEMPPARILHMLEASGARRVVTQSRFRRLIAGSGVAQLLLDEAANELALQPGSNPGLRISPDGAAYGIFTSGSTGRPKCAINTHRAIVNRLLWISDQFPPQPGDCVLQKTPYGFDVSLWELFWPLLAGVRMVLARPGGHLDPEYLLDTIEREHVTTVHFVPSMLSVFLEADGLERALSLRRIICSGEALTAELVARAHRLLEAEIHNLYGPTEAAVDVTHWHCKRVPEAAAIPIGKPIANTQIHILGEDFHPVEPGCVGQIYIAGTPVGRGYAHQPALTASKFLPDPFGGRPGALMYATGDLGRHRPDGNIDYFGRIDSQIKLHGQRIELGEIESVLRQFPGVREGAVAVSTGQKTEVRLIAYLVTTKGQRPSETVLRRFMEARLPRHMVPHRFVFLSELPRNANGKLDRRSLAAKPETENTRSELEEILHELSRVSDDEARSLLAGKNA